MFWGLVFQPTTDVAAQFCDTLVVRVSGYRSGADGGEGPLSEPSELIRFVDEEDAGGSGGVGGGENPGYEPPWQGSADAGVLLDFDGDRKSDILVRNAETGELELWTLEGDQARTISALPSLAPEAQVVGNGDMNGDGSADLLYLNGDTGELGVWLIAGGAVIGGGEIADLAPDWDVIGNGDHDGDGRADVLLWHQTTGKLELWTMNGPEILEKGPLSHVHGTGWKVAATGDYDGDGFLDLLAHLSGRGRMLRVLFTNGSEILDNVRVADLPPLWFVAGVGERSPLP